MTNRYLLYIDILGFRDLVRTGPAEVHRLYKIIDTLNVHGHDSFKTIVFSDTILVYNLFEAQSEGDHEYAVMFSCEFAQDLLYRLARRNIFFRAVLDYGPFEHYSLANTPCFFGPALIAAYDAEKRLPAIGLFATTACIAYNSVFSSLPFGGDLHFIFLTQGLDRVQLYTGGHLPADPVLNETDDLYKVIEELSFLKSVYTSMRSDLPPSVRAKHLATYDLYRRKYPVLMESLEKNGFRREAVSPTLEWSGYEREIESWEADEM
jgi:hypothetical protein